MLPEFLKARVSIVICGYGIILRLLAVHSELWDSILCVTATKAFGTGMAVIGFLFMLTYLLEGILAMQKVKVQVKKVNAEKKPQKQ